MSVPRFAAALLTVSFLAAAPIYAEETRPPVSDAAGISAFLLRADSGARSFVSDAADPDALGAVARSWASKADPRRVANLVAVAAPGSSGEGRLVQALSKWTGAGRIVASMEKDGAIAFLEDAAAQAEKLLHDPRVKSEVDAAVAASDQTGGPGGGSRAAVERARRLSGQKIGIGFGSNRNPGAIGDNRGAPGNGAAQVRGGIVNGSNAAASASLGAAGSRTGAVEAAGGAVPAGVSAASFRPAIPANFKKANVVPPLAMIDLNASDRVINKVLSVVNMESFSRKNTLNRESTGGTQAAICRFLIQAKYDPDEAWSKSKAARDAPGSDPGDLDLRNAEHYLYAYSTTAKPNGWGDSTPVQLLMAVGWTPFKTVTKHVRSTSTPSLEEAKWGVKGAWHGQHPPDWRGTCEGAKP